MARPRTGLRLTPPPTETSAPTPDPPGTELCLAGALTLKRAVREFGVCRDTLYAAINAGELPYAKWGRLTLIPRRALARLVAARLARKGRASPPPGSAGEGSRP